MNHARLAPRIVRQGDRSIAEVFGADIRVKASAADTGGAFSLIDYVTAAGWPGPPLHVHDETDEGFFILEGHYRFHVAGDVHELGPGDWIFIPRGTAHRFMGSEEGSGRVLIVYRPGGFEGYFREIGELLAEDPTWPPEDPTILPELGRAYDQRLVASATGIH